MKIPLPDLCGTVVMLADPGALALIDRVMTQKPAEVLVPEWALYAGDLRPSRSMRVVQTATGRNHLLAHSAWIMSGKEDVTRPADIRLTAASAALEALADIEPTLAGRRLVVLTCCERTQRILLAAVTVEEIDVVLVGDPADSWGQELVARKGRVPRGTLRDGGENA